MNNQELELKVKEILEITNFFDMVEAALGFEKEYKNTLFFKKTKMPLIEVIKNSKAWYIAQLDNISNKIQSLIDNIDLSNLQDVVNQFGSIYELENQETLNIIKEFKDIVK
jgi:hypothetical protein